MDTIHVSKALDYIQMSGIALVFTNVWMLERTIPIALTSSKDSDVLPEWFSRGLDIHAVRL